LATKDAKIMIRRKLRTKDLPKGDGWSWNQSRGRKSTQSVDNNIDLCFYKLTTRVRAHTGENPGYKLWIFNITDQTTRTTTSFLWCERGQEFENNTQMQQQPQHPRNSTPQPQSQEKSNWTISSWKKNNYGQTENPPPILAPLKLSNTSPSAFSSQRLPILGLKQEAEDNTISPLSNSVNVAASTLTNIHRESSSVSSPQDIQNRNEQSIPTLAPLYPKDFNDTKQNITAIAVQQLVSLSSSPGRRRKYPHDTSNATRVSADSIPTVETKSTFDTMHPIRNISPHRIVTEHLRKRNFYGDLPVSKLPKQNFGPQKEHLEQNAVTTP